MTLTLPSSDVSRRLGGESSNVWQIHTDALARADQGEDILLLSVGDPDFPTPPDIAAYLVQQVEHGRTHYSPAGGEPALLQALASLETRIEGRPFDPSQFTIFPGGTAALHGTFSCIANPGDEVIVPEPMYLGYHSIFSALGVHVVTVPLTDDEFEVQPDAIEAAITDRTCAVLVNTPGNPCGNIIGADTLRSLAALCRQRNLWLICDEVYSVFTYEGEHVSALKVAEDLDNVVVIDSLSKSHAMSGWRIGWAVASPEFTQALHRFCSAAYFGCSQFIQDAAAYALSVNAPHVLEMRNQYRARRDYAVQRIGRFNHLSCFPPKAGMFVMMDVSRTGKDGLAFARHLLDKAGISTIPGSAFGDSTRNYVRLSLTHPVHTLAEAFDRIEYVG